MMAKVPVPTDFVGPWTEDAAELAQTLKKNREHYAPLEQVDPELNNLILKETWRQFSVLDLIASLVPPQVLHLHRILIAIRTLRTSPAVLLSKRMGPSTQISSSGAFLAKDTMEEKWYFLLTHLSQVCIDS
jgi:hypothetical protein